MIINCLLQNIENNVLELYNPKTKETFNLKVTTEEAEAYQELLQETDKESLNTDDFDEPALAIVGYDIDKHSITEPN